MQGTAKDKMSKKIDYYKIIDNGLFDYFDSPIPSFILAYINRTQKYTKRRWVYRSIRQMMSDLKLGRYVIENAIDQLIESGLLEREKVDRNWQYSVSENRIQDFIDRLSTKTIANISEGQKDTFANISEDPLENTETPFANISERTDNPFANISEQNGGTFANISERSSTYTKNNKNINKRTCVNVPEGALDDPSGSASKKLISDEKTDERVFSYGSRPSEGGPLQVGMNPPPTQSSFYVHKLISQDVDLALQTTEWLDQEFASLRFDR